MKRFYILCLLLSTMGFSQQGINYKAVIQDGDQIVANTPVTIYFTIKENGTIDIYKETRLITTNKNGIVVTNIGEGSPTLGVFETIDWTKEQFLNVAIDIGNGLVDLGTTAFKQVPYALHAKTAETFTGTITNMGNLVKVTENGNEGYRLADAVIANHGDIGEEAIDLSFQSSESETRGATQEGAFASGYNTEASAEYSVAFGYNTQAADTYATSFGAYTEALGHSSSAFGSSTKASGYYSTVFGRETIAASYNQTTIGSYNTNVSSSSKSFVETDPLFVIGNGTNINDRSDALVMLKNGNTEINGVLTVDANNDDSGYTLPISKGEAGEVLVMNTSDSGTHWEAANSFGSLESVPRGFDFGYRLLGRDPDKYGNVGQNALDLSISKGTGNYGATGYYSVAMGSTTKASGRYAIAMGESTIASGLNSIAIGKNTRATGISTLAIGSNTIASGDYAVTFNSGTLASGNHSTAMGQGTTAIGNRSIAMGSLTTSESFAQTTIGQYNTNSGGSITSFVATDPLFVIGNGTGSANVSDAMVVLKNGNTTINGALDVEEVQGKDSGDADMKAYIYGLITSVGEVTSASSAGFTISKTGTGAYRVVFNNPPSNYRDYMVVSSLHGDIGFIKTVRNTSYIAVNTYSTSGSLSDESFNFVVFKK
ncbi:hypothetical protein [uncultured Algibacter sp.]|uniref:hypothetical protein n=1 Tax=uncultured Algibacter sp. TaxID=298659 RepID=UPI00260AB4D0|nr:hypothetical protein [uncultured Algibacter sp.]